MCVGGVKLEIMITPTILPYHVPFSPVLNALQEALGTDAKRLFLVGGAVRDALLRRPAKDLDFAVAGDGQPWARRIANAFQGSFYRLDPTRGVGRAIIEYEGERYNVDVASQRGDSLADDLSRRDFTLNAIGIALSEIDAEPQPFLDPLGGIADLTARRLRLCAPSAISDDPIRALRAVRQSVAFKLLMTPDTLAAIKREGALFRQTSPERVRDEFMAILGGVRPHVALRTLDMLGLLSLIIPEVDAMRGLAQRKAHIYDLLAHTYAVVERLDGVLTVISPERTDDTAADSALGMIVYSLDRYRRALQTHLAHLFPNGRSVRALLILAALLHDSGKPSVRSVDADGDPRFFGHEAASAEIARAHAEALRLSNEESERLVGVVARHNLISDLVEAAAQEGDALTPRLIHRYWRATGDLGGVDICLLAQADYLGKVGAALNVHTWLGRLQVIEALLDAYVNHYDQRIAPPPLVSGTDLMNTLGLTPSPQIGRLLTLLLEEQAVGTIHTAEEALALARILLEGS